MSRRDKITNLIRIHENRLQKLKEQQAFRGIYNVDPAISIEIKELEVKVEDLQTELGLPENASSTPTTMLADRGLFAQFLQDFPSDGKSVYFLRDHDIGGSFGLEQLEQIHYFLNHWNDAEHEFFNPELEQSRKALFDTLKTFDEELGKYSSTSIWAPQIHSRGFNDVEERPHMLELRDRLNDLVTEAYKRHQDFVCAGRRILDPL